MILPIYIYNHPVLREKCNDVSKNYQDLDKVVIKKITLGKNGNDILVYHNGPWNIYRDIGFQKAVKSITSIDFKFSEQGMQKNKIAHMEIDSKKIVKLIKNKKI